VIFVYSVQLPWEKIEVKRTCCPFDVFIMSSILEFVNKMTLPGCVVTAFVPNLNTTRNLDTYLNLGRELMRVGVPKVVFLEKSLIEKMPSNPLTIYLPYDFEPFPQTLELPQTRNKDKDTQNYLHLQNLKPWFCAQAARLNPFACSQFIWMDFGLLHVCDKSTFSADVQRACQKQYNQLRIATIWPLNDTTGIADQMCWFCAGACFGDKKGLTNRGCWFCARCSTDYVCWFCAGGCFGGDKESILKFAQLTEKKLKEIVESGKLTWEVNVFAFVLKEHPELFSPYYGSHDSTIIRHY
jgi:hypothetical protein